MSLRLRFLITPILLGALGGMASLPVAAQPAKKGGMTILAEPLSVRPGEALSTRTLVQRPQAVGSAVSWTIETKRHRGYISISALSPDGKKIATGGLDGIVRIWNAETGAFQRALVGHNSYVYGLAWSPDGTALASAGSFDGTARIWDAETGMPLRVLSKDHKGYTTHVAWSRDGKWLLVAGGMSGFLTLWDVARAEPVKTSETGKPITGLSFGPDPKLVAVSGTGMGVQVWDVREGKTPLVMVVPTQNGSAVAWSADGKLIVGGSATKTLIWDAENGKEKHVLDSPCSALAFSPKGDELAVSTGVGVKVWTAFDKEPKVLPLVDARTLAWSPDGSGLYGTGAVAVRWQPLNEKQAARNIDAAADFPVHLSPGRPLVTGFGTLTPQLWDTTTGKLVATLEGHTGGVTAVAWSKDGKTLATASADKTVRLWDASGKSVRTLEGHEGPVTCLAWADGKTLASGSSDKTARVWQTSAAIGKLARTHKGPVTAVAWSKDGKTLASGDTQHTVIAGAPGDGDKAQVITATESVQALAWAPGGKALAVGLETGNVEVFAPAGGKLMQTYERNGSPPQITSLMWAPDGSALLSGRANHTAQVWPASGVKALFDLQCMAPVTHAAWSAAGNAMVLSESDRAVRVFDLATGQLRATVVADRKQVAVVSATGNFHVADEHTCELVYVVQTNKGQETLAPEAAVAKFKFRNAPNITLTDK
jgi:WD40 repeat protein